MGDHFVVGTTGLDLRVAVGIGAAVGEVEPSELAAAAMASIRETTGRAATRGAGSPPPFVAVTHIPDRHVSILTGAHNGTKSGAPRSLRRPSPWPPSRLLRRVLVPLAADGDIGNVVSSLAAWPSPLAGDTSAPWATGLRVLLVDPEPGSDSTPRPMVDAVAAVTRRAGAQPIVASALDPDAVLLNLYLTEPDVVVIVLQALASRPEMGPNWGRAWERPAQLARALREVGVPVVALGMGASAAALAVCVEQGAVGLFHSDLLPQELARLAAARSNGSNGSTPGAPSVRDDARSPGQLPAPYNALVHLTPSERRVLFHMMEGSSASEIADMLVVSLTTVRSHIRSILRKLNVNSQLAAVALAFGTLPRQASAG
jgi:DNA-binding NarL/FixJ family response regulator